METLAAAALALTAPAPGVPVNAALSGALFATLAPAENRGTLALTAGTASLSVYLSIGATAAFAAVLLRRLAGVPDPPGVSAPKPNAAVMRAARP